MSRHDAILSLARKFLAADEPSMTPSSLIYALDAALREEIKAHDVTRLERNTRTEHVDSLLGNVRGLEAKVGALQAATENLRLRHERCVANADRHDGYLAGLAAAKAAIEALEKGE